MGRPINDLTNYETIDLIVLNENKSFKNRTYWKVKCKICCKEGFLRQDLIKKDGRCDCSKIKPKINKKIGKFCGTYFHYLQKQAEHRNIPWEINGDYIWEIFEKQEGKCALSKEKLEINYSQDNRRVGNVSLDRIDNSKGYIKGNIWFITSDINYMKKNHSVKYFIELCKKIIENYKP